MLKQINFCVSTGEFDKTINRLDGLTIVTMATQTYHFESFN